MGKIYPGIDGKLERWIGRQQLFFVATAPDGAGHVNLSPKGPIESLRVLDPHTVAYLDFVGSGAARDLAAGGGPADAGRKLRASTI